MEIVLLRPYIFEVEYIIVKKYGAQSVDLWQRCISCDDPDMTYLFSNAKVNEEHEDMLIANRR